MRYAEMVHAYRRRKEDFHGCIQSSSPVAGGFFNGDIVQTVGEKPRIGQVFDEGISPDEKCRGCVPVLFVTDHGPQVDHVPADNLDLTRY